MATNITSTSTRGGVGGGLSAAWLRFNSIRPGDPGTRARVLMRVRKNLGETAADVRASSVGGYVELRGSVPNREAFDRAAEAARGAFGARGVLNFLEIR